MPTFADDYEAMRALSGRLTNVFNAGGDYEADFASYGGVDVQIKTDEDDEPENVGRPLILIEQESGELSDWSGCDGKIRDVVVIATTYVSDASGGQQGTANPITSDELLSKRLVAEVTDNYAAFQDLGLMNIRIVPQRMSKDRDAVVRRIAHRISFKYSK